MKTKNLSAVMLFLTAFIWGFAFVAQVSGASYVEPFTFNAVRFAIGTISLIPVVLFFEKGRSEPIVRKKTFRASLISGSFLFTASMLQQFGVQYTRSAGVAGFITGLYTVLVPIACLFLFKSKVAVYKWIGAVCAVAGLFLLCYKPDEGLSFGVGELVLFIGAFFWAAHVISVDRLGKDIRSLHFAWGQFVVCSILCFIFMLIFEEPRFESIYLAKWSLLYCGIPSVAVAYTLQIVAQKRSDPTVAVIILSTESVFSAIGGVIFGIDTISVIGYIGCALIFCGIVVSQINIEKKKRLE